MTLNERWELVTEDCKDYLDFEKVQNKRSQRPDLHGLLLLDQLFPGTSNMIVDADDDGVWLGVSAEQLETLSDEQIIELSRCGIGYDPDSGLYMFV